MIYITTLSKRQAQRYHRHTRALREYLRRRYIMPTPVNRHVPHRVDRVLNRHGMIERLEVVYPTRTLIVKRLEKIYSKIMGIKVIIKPALNRNEVLGIGLIKTPYKFLGLTKALQCIDCANVGTMNGPQLRLRCHSWNKDLSASLFYLVLLDPFPEKWENARTFANVEELNTTGNLPMTYLKEIDIIGGPVRIHDIGVPTTPEELF